MNLWASWFVMNASSVTFIIFRVRIYLMPLDQTCLLSLVSTRTSGVPIIFSANFLISLMARGALLLKPTPWSRLCRLMVNSRVTTSFMALFLRSPFCFAILTAVMRNKVILSHADNNNNTRVCRHVGVSSRYGSNIFGRKTQFSDRTEPVDVRPASLTTESGIQSGRKNRPSTDGRGFQPNVNLPEGNTPGSNGNFNSEGKI